MGVSANLWTKAKKEELLDFLGAKSGDTHDWGFSVVFKEPVDGYVDLSYHHQSETPVGVMPLLSAWRNTPEAVAMLDRVAKRFGGLLERSDYDCNVEMVYQE